MTKIRDYANRYDLLSVGVTVGLASWVFDGIAGFYSSGIYLKILSATITVVLLSIGSVDTLRRQRIREEWIELVRWLRWIFLVFWIVMFIANLLIYTLHGITYAVMHM